MTLSTLDRGYLDETIDDIIEAVPDNVRLFRTAKTKFQLIEPNDAAFGAAYGSILSGFITYYINKYRTAPKQSEMDEVVKIILRRLREIRDAIFSAG